ncbi:hypothetical protein EZL74_12470 [Flavobacterium silvisoli]|uniref:Uncharacterized protein n=1 Tax=Flavobacterium silvisoli TaxID=2529433 RepID=A0A4Q9YRN2_9FLAO|nr:hypothetical protein [Flavobacterium silvisoli]TBX65199.1 hypothetical protein EZL74_12470 [Flavobacterium silvisoli]
MKQNVFLFLAIMQFISCNTTKQKNIADENCYIVLNSVSNVISVGDKRDVCLTQMIDEVRNGKKVDAENLKKLQNLQKEINKRLLESLKNLETESAKNKNEKIFDVSIQYLKKIQNMERQFPILISDMSDDIPENNSRYSDSIAISTKEIEKFYVLYRDTMHQYLEVHNINDRKFDSIQAVVDKKYKT